MGLGRVSGCWVAIDHRVAETLVFAALSSSSATAGSVKTVTTPSDAVPGPASASLGTLTSVSTRTIWKNEQLDFTPWLLANAGELGRVLGMKLSITAAEHPVGGFALDLIGTDEANGERVIIENQLEQTDHGHLGQLLTYAGGTEPANIVWIATKFRPEHRAALDWLNTRTDEATRFFGVEVSVVRIGPSPSAPLFQLVVQPNDWGKKVKASADGRTELQLAYARFWTDWLDRAQPEGWTKTSKGPLNNWLDMPSGTTGITYGCVFGKGGAYSELFFGDPSPAVNEARFTWLEGRQAALQTSYGSPIEFESLAGKKGARVYEFREASFADESRWDEYGQFFLDAQRRLRAAINDLGGIQALAAVKGDDAASHGTPISGAPD